MEKMSGGNLNDSAFNTFIVGNDTEFDVHLSGFKKLKAVSYVVSIKWLIEFLEKNEFERIEILVGKEVSDLNPEEVLKDEIEKDKGGLLNNLMKLVEEERLLIYTSNRIVHSKFYILSSEKSIRVIQGSANLTISARKGKQVNYLWEWTLKKYKEGKDIS